VKILASYSLVDCGTCNVCGTRLPWAGMGYTQHDAERCQRRLRQVRAALLQLLVRRSHDPEIDRKLNAFLAMDDPWPTFEVLRKLADAGEHLLRDHDCDVHGWEEIDTAVRIARERLAKLEAR